MTLKEIAAVAYSGSLPPEIGTGLDATDFFAPPGTTFPFGADIAVVEVDPETGEVAILRYIAIDDCGRQISPLLVDGQVHGGLTQGIAQALYEEVVYDDQGQLVTGSLMDYAVAEGRVPADVRERPHRDALAAQPAGGQGHRRTGDDRLDPGDRQRGGGRAQPLRHHPPRHAAASPSASGRPSRTPAARRAGRQIRHLKHLN